jgi:hypothetical protein
MRCVFILTLGLSVGLAACNETATEPFFYFEEVCTGEYSDFQLYNFEYVAGPVLSVTGVTWLALDMESRCLEVGVASRDVIPSAAAKLEELEVPRDAVTFFRFAGGQRVAW